MGLLAFLEWASTSKTPIRNEVGDLLVWDDDLNEFKQIEAFGLVSLYMGEIGERNVQLREQVTKCEQRLTANGLSQLNVSFHDPGFEMYKNGVFELERTINFNGYFYRITSVTTAYKSNSELVRVDADSYNGYKLKEDRGQATFNMSPTAFAESKAAEMGLSFFGEATPVGDPIVRRQDGDTDESTWDVLSRLARENEFSLFEANNRLFFASDREILAEQVPQVVNLPADLSDPLVLLSADFKKSVKDEFSGRVDLRFHKNSPATRLTPGMAMRCIGMGDFDTVDLMIENVVFDASPTSQVKVTTRSTEPRGGCKLQTFQRGATGDCVRRIQMAVREFSKLVRVSNPAPRQLERGLNPAEQAARFGLEANSDGTSGTVQSDRNLPAAVARGRFFQALNSVNDAEDTIWDRYTNDRVSTQPTETVRRTVQLKIDGIFGPNTETAVKQFQTREGLPSTGIVDAATWEAIERAT